MPTPFFTPIPGFSEDRFNGATLVVPIVSVGNVPQLTVDIVISTLPNLRRVGYLSSLDLVPFLGGPEEPSKDQGVVTALEVFGVLDQDDGSYMDTFWVQQRSPVLKNRKEAYLTSFVSWIRQAQFGKLLLLSSLDASSRVDDLGSNPSKHHHLPLPSVLSLPFPGPLSTSYPAYSSSSFEDPLTAPLPTISAHPIPGATSTSTTVTQPPPPSTVLPPLPGSGILSPLLLQLNASVPTGVVLSFVVEGDNRADAREMAGVVDVVLDLGVGRDGAGGWREPESWEGLGREEGEGRREW
ncbi:PAC2 family-domain-containing protein [Mrakia frigida]|uniref:Add66p n=1 Tax=Mrakia frigida TaxID=29902 RepID=UPI003FCBFBAF